MYPKEIISQLENVIRLFPRLSETARAELMHLGRYFLPETHGNAFGLTTALALSLRPKSLGMSEDQLKQLRLQYIKAVPYLDNKIFISSKTRKIQFPHYHSLDRLSRATKIFRDLDGNLCDKPRYLCECVTLDSSLDCYVLRLHPKDQIYVSSLADLLLEAYRPALNIESNVLDLKCYRKDVLALSKVLIRFSDSRTAPVPDIDIRATVLEWIQHDLIKMNEGGTLTQSIHNHYRRAFELLLTKELAQTGPFMEYAARSIAKPYRDAPVRRKFAGKKKSKNGAKHHYEARSLLRIAIPRSQSESSYEQRSVPLQVPENLAGTETAHAGMRTVHTHKVPLNIGNLGQANINIPPTATTSSAHESKPRTPRPRTRTAEKNVVSVCDPNRIPPPTISDYFDSLCRREPWVRAYNWICLFVGIDWKALTELYLIQGPRPPNLEAPHVDATTGVLSYPILGGATTFIAEGAEKTPNAVMQLILPTQVLGWLVSTGLPRPFQNCGDEPCNIAKYYSQVNPGITPTPERLNATFVSSVASFGLDELEAATIKGGIPRHLLAQAKYRSFDLALLNARHRHAVAGFTKYLLEIAKDKASLVWLRVDYPQAAVHGRIGSQVYCASACFRSLIAAVRTIFSKTRHAIHQTQASDRLTSWIALLNLQQLQLYIIEQLTVGIRPVGQVVQLYFAGHEYGCLVKDKGSSEFTELTLSPELTVLRKQADACIKGIKKFTAFAEHLGVPIVSDVNFRSSNLAIFATHVRHHGSDTIKIARMTGADFEHLLQMYDLNRNFPRPVLQSNAFRHTQATDLAKRLSPSVLSEFLGHQRDGLEYFSPWSTAQGPLLPKIEYALDEIVKELRIITLDI